MELWSQAHIRTLLPSLVVMMILALLFRKLFGGMEWKKRMIPIQVLAVILVALEIGKQAVSFAKGYDLYHLLFHFCSLLVFMIPIMAFYRGKHQQNVNAISSALVTSVFLLTVIYPSLIYSADNIANFSSDYFSFHTVVFHNIVVFMFFLLIALDLYTPASTGEGKAITVFMLCFCVVSATMAQLLKTNFNNFYSCNVPPLEDLRLTMQAILGYGLTQAIYIFIVTVLDILFVHMSYWLLRVCCHMLQRRKFKTVTKSHG